MEIKEITRDKNVIVKEFAFDAKDIRRLEDKTANTLNKRGYHIEGFRVGRVPKDIYKMRLKDAFYSIYLADEAIREVERELDKENFNVVIPPVISEATFNENGGSITVEIHLEPEIKIDPTQLKLRKAKEDEVLDGYVDMRIKYLIDEHAILQPKDSEAAEGDLVKVKETVLLEDKKIRDAEDREYILLKDDERDVIKNLYGKKKGDIVEFEKVFEKSDDEKILYKYILEIEGVFERILPELNDEFIKTLDIEEVQTVDLLKEKFRSEGKEIYDKELDESYKVQIIDQLPNIVEIEISEKTLERAVENIIENLKEENKYENYIQNYGSEDKLKEELKTYYQNLLKKDLAVKKIAEENDIKVTDEDIKEFAAKISVEWGISPDRAESLIKQKKDLRNQVVMEIVELKVAKILQNSAQIEEVPVKEDKENE